MEVVERGQGQYKGRSPKAPALCRISHVDFRGIRLDELLRIPIPRTRVNRGKKSKAGLQAAPALCNSLRRFLRSAGVPDLAHRSRSARAAPEQVVEFASLAHLQVDGPLEPGCEPAHLASGSVARPYPPAAEVRKEVVADITTRVLPGGGIVEGAAGYGATSVLHAAIPVGEDRIAVRRVRLGAFISRPPVVRSRSPPIDLLPGILPHVVYEGRHPADHGHQLEGVAQSQGPDSPVFAGSRGVEGVVGGDGAVLVYPKHLAEEVGELLRVGRGFVVPGCDVELAVFAGVYSPAHVMVGSLVAQLEDELLAARDDLVTAGGDAHDTVVGRGGRGRLLGVLEVDVAVGGEA